MTATTTTTNHNTVTLGRTTYTVQSFTHNWTENGTDHEMTDTILTGPRGATYILRPFLGQDNGLRQVISFKSGQPLRVNGNEVRVHHIGDIIEVA